MKFWTNWPYWVRGGVLGFCAFLPMLFSFDHFSFFGKVLDTINLILGLPALAVGSIFIKIFEGVFGVALSNDPISVSRAIVAVSYFSEGAILGWLYGKIKNRKK